MEPHEHDAGLADLPTDLLFSICAALVDDYCDGVRSLVCLAQSSNRLYRLCTSMPCISRCLACYGIETGASRASLACSLAVLGVAETVAGLGTNRIYVHRRNGVCGQRMVLRPGSSTSRLVEFALLLRRHPTLHVVVEAHESAHEGYELTDGGRSTHMTYGVSQERADVVLGALAELECLERLAPSGARVWGTLPSARFGPRVRCRAWADRVAEEAQWGRGLNTSHTELFFTIDGIEMPPRGPHYERALLSAPNCTAEISFPSIRHQAES